MISLRSFLRDIFPPLATFLPLSFAGFHFLFLHMIRSGVAKQLAAQCPAQLGATPYRQAYTGSAILDKRLCILVAFFSAALDSPRAKPFVGYFLAQFPSFFMLPILQSLRSQLPFILKNPTTIGLLYQNLGGAVIIPLYHALLLTIGGSDISLDASQVDIRILEGTLAGLVFGFWVPSAWMYLTTTPKATAAWQLFPLWMYIFRLVWFAFRQSTSFSPGYSPSTIIDAIHTFNLIASMTAHLAFVWPRLLSPSELSQTFVPSVSVPDRKKATLLSGITQFLQWDGIIIILSSFALSVWFMETWALAARALIWLVTASIIIGPGAALSSLLLWKHKTRW